VDNDARSTYIIFSVRAIARFIWKLHKLMNCPT